MARRMAADMGCPFGCGCRFAWHDVAFTCGGAPLVRLREEWVAEAKEAARVLAARRPHSQMRQVLRRGVDGAGTALRHGPADAVESASYTHPRAHETVLDLVCRLLLEKKKKNNNNNNTPTTTTTTKTTTLI